MLRFTVLSTLGCYALADEPVFSGPQVGERFAPFDIRTVLDESANDPLDVIAQADGGPILVVFVHEITRPSMALIRVVMEYASKKENEGLMRAIVFLSADPTETETWLKRIRNSPALPRAVPIGISVDGVEGPGAYGLNREMTLTVLIGKENLVTANFPLVQPSVAADAPRIAAAIAEVLGREEQPTLADLGIDRQQGRMPQDDDRFRELLGPVIRKSATPDQVDAAAQKVEDRAAQDAAFKERVATVAGRIISAGRLESYGTPRAQEYLQKWAEEFRGDSR
jgi:hypothetical protein